jgi:predicted metal-dependent phosphoesterase TrpH
MHSLPFDKPGRFYRGNLHLHSTNSDGAKSPADTLAGYRERGYDFVSLTDHFLPKDDVAPVVSDTRNLGAEGFTTILGAEIHGPGMECGDLWHIVANGLPLDFPWIGREETGREVAARAREAGAFISLAHPFWSTTSVVDAETLLDLAHAVEVYNHGCEVEVARGESWHFTDLLLAKGHRLNATATDDAHMKHPGDAERDAYGGWVQVKAESLDEAALLAALKTGHYYSSTGPELHDVRVEGDRLHVACSPVDVIIVSGEGSRSQRVVPGPVEGGSVSLEPFRRAGWCRVTAMAIDGTKAWSNPIWLDE